MKQEIDIKKDMRKITEDVKDLVTNRGYEFWSLQLTYRPQYETFEWFIAISRIPNKSLCVIGQSQWLEYAVEEALQTAELRNEKDTQNYNPTYTKE